jgi:hypothetical protein
MVPCKCAVDMNYNQNIKYARNISLVQTLILEVFENVRWLVICPLQNTQGTR